MTTDWQTIRRHYIGGSEVAALFADIPEDCPYSSPWQLWASKTGLLPARAESEPMKWGKRHEGTVLRAAAEDWGLAVQPWESVTQDQLTLPPFVTAAQTDRGLFLMHECGVGGTPDGLVVVDGRVGIIEAKTVSEWQWRSWGEQLPGNYRLQGQTYAGLLDVEFVVYPVLVGGNRLVRFTVEAWPEVFDAICEQAAAFWRAVREGREPPIVGKDYEAVRDWFGTLDVPPAGKKDKPVVVDTEEAAEWLTRFAEVYREHATARAHADELGKRLDALKAEGMRLLHGHRKAQVGQWRFTRVDVAARPERVEVKKATAGHAYIKAIEPGEDA